MYVSDTHTHTHTHTDTLFLSEARNRDVQPESMINPEGMSTKV